MIEKIKNIIDADDIKLDEYLKDHTSYRIGGPAEIYVYPKNKDQLVKLIKLLKGSNYQYFVIGKGSNILVSDDGFKGCIIDLTKHFSGIRVDGEIMTVGSGALLTAIAFEAIKQSLSGFEELAGIPGTIGGAVLMNAGCYGNEISDHIVSVTVIDPQNEVKELSVDNIQFAYRKTSIKNNIVVEVKLKLKFDEQARIRNKTDEHLIKRRESQPLDLPSCGSVFKRPVNNFAGKLIEDAGLKGKIIGGAKISEKHAGFIVNFSNATSKDVREVIKLVKETVNNKFNIMLEEEVIYLG
ncbi:MAG: UDP-N-acetylmuramate dehydrogenase [Candidatus Delongbacteria bacterium]|nr:UDP-N-acetylmuramate dehydrogenase [Candidatus Delongbacteria bacterium]